MVPHLTYKLAKILSFPIYWTSTDEFLIKNTSVLPVVLSSLYSGMRGNKYESVRRSVDVLCINYSPYIARFVMPDVIKYTSSRTRKECESHYILFQKASYYYLNASEIYSSDVILAIGTHAFCNSDSELGHRAVLAISNYLDFTVCGSLACSQGFRSHPARLTADGSKPWSPTATRRRSTSGEPGPC